MHFCSRKRSLEHLFKHVHFSLGYTQASGYGLPTLYTSLHFIDDLHGFVFAYHILLRGIKQHLKVSMIGVGKDSVKIGLRLPSMRENSLSWVAFDTFRLRLIK